MKKYSEKYKEPITKELIKDKLKTILDFPKPGIQFKDISPILKEPKLVRFMINDIVEHIKMDDIDIVVGLDARGFILGPMIADKIDVGFGMIRKAGKLPPPYVQKEYELEYGTSKIAISPEIIQEGMNVHVYNIIK